MIIVDRTVGTDEGFKAFLDDVHTLKESSFDHPFKHTRIKCSSRYMKRTNFMDSVITKIVSHTHRQTSFNRRFKDVEYEYVSCDRCCSRSQITVAAWP